MISVFKLTTYECIKRKIFLYSFIVYICLFFLVNVITGDNPLLLTNKYLLSIIYYLSVIFLIFISFDMISRNIEDGSIELYLSKPIGRNEFFLYRFFSVILIIPFTNFVFQILLTLLVLFKTGEFNICYIKVFVSVFVIFCVFFSSFLITSILTYRFNMNLLIFIGFIIFNIFYNIVDNFIIIKNSIKITEIIFLFYFFSPRFVEFCSLAVNNNENYVNLYLHSFLFILLCLFISNIIIYNSDF